MAYVWAHQGQWERAFEFFEKSLIGYDDYNWLQIDPDFEILRARPEWKALMQKHFPDQVKD